jgi:glycosyltransferase involved in cell wall biosynthesis
MCDYNFVMQMSQVQVSIIIPTFNEAENIAGVLSSIPGDYTTDILVVDGGSQDGTAEIAISAGARVIYEPRKGYGWACAAGLAAAQGEIVVFMDGDGEDDPRYLPELVSPILENQAEMVQGARQSRLSDPGAMPWHQRFGNELAASLIRLLYHLPLSDLSPFRAVRREALLGLAMVEMTYGWPTEMIVKAAKTGWRIREVPIAYHPRRAGKSKISGTFKGTVLAAYYIIGTILKFSLRRTL